MANENNEMWRAYHEVGRGARKARAAMNVQALNVAAGKGVIVWNGCGDHIVVRLPNGHAEAHFWPTTGTAGVNGKYRKGLIVADVITWLEQLE
jgi:hypothetical protein